MSVRRFGKSWYVDVTWRGKRHRIRSPDNSIAGARILEQSARRALAEDGNLDRLDPRKQVRQPTFAEFAERWMRDYVQPTNKWSERERKRSVLKSDFLPMFGALSLVAITSEQIDRYKAERIAAGLNPKTVNNRVSILRKCLSTAVEWGDLKTLPRVRFLKTAEREVRHISEEELQRLLACITDPVIRAMAIFAARTGLRFCELIALEWQDVDLEHARIVVQRASVDGHVDSPKNYRIRVVPLPAETVAMLRPIAKREGLVFERNGRPVSRDTARWHLTGAVRRAGVGKLGWHTLRHTYASHLVSKGGSLRAIQALLGHATIDMTLRYAHLAPDVLRDTVQLLEPSANLGPPAGRQHHSVPPAAAIPTSPIPDSPPS